jgi:hypothetical protein
MRRIIIVLLAGALLVGPFASVASAHHDPVREAFCLLADKLGVTWVQDCNLH